MTARHKDVFRFVSLRGPERSHSVDPSKDVPSEVVELLEEFPDLSNTVDLARHLAHVTVLTEADLEKSIVAIAEAAIRREHIDSFDDLQNLRIELSDGDSKTIEQVADTTAFRRDYTRITDSWLKLRLTQPSADHVSRHEELILIAHLVHATLHDPAPLHEAGALGRYQRAHVTLPKSLNPISRREARVREHHRKKFHETQVVETSDRSDAIAKEIAEYHHLLERIRQLEAIQAKAHRIYFAWKHEQLSSRPDRPTSWPRGGLVQRAGAGLLGRQAPKPGPRSTEPLRLDSSYFTNLKEALSAEERGLFESVVGNPFLPDMLDAVLEVFDPNRAIYEANRKCHQIRLWEDEKQSRLPDAPPASRLKEHPLVRAIGWGDLVVARERLIGYDAREVAHIENILPGEMKLREHQRERTVQEVIETETVSETESERDLQTTDRHELQSESRQTIEQEYSIEAGVNTSGRYGLTHVETSLQAGFQQSKSEARSSAQSVSREIVSRAVERTFEKVRQIRRLTITDQIRELNRHKVDNSRIEGTGVPPSISGIYLWAEKLLEVELRQYGTRMLVEFYIPEPAISLLEQQTTQLQGPRKPAPFSLTPADIQPGNYMCLTELYGAQEVQPPPAQYISTGYAWASAPSEETESWSQDAVADIIAIPPGYKPVDGHAVFSAHPHNVAIVDVFMAVGGHVILDRAGVNFDEGEIDFDPAHTWPNGVPVTIRGVGHFDKTLTAQVSLRCQRTAEALASWQLATWEQLREAHEALMHAYRAEAEEQEMRNALSGRLGERPDAENRRLELEELRKWAIKAMRLAPFDFNSIERVGDFQEIDPLSGDLQAAVARLFEEAFEWEQSSFFLHPYYWARRETWKLRAGLEAADTRHTAFLRAGSARLIVPITPGYEERVLYYLESDPTINEVDRLDGPPGGSMPADTGFADLWLELLVDRRPEVAVGSGTLSVTNGDNVVRINTDSNWRADQGHDLGRELFVDGDQYVIARVPNAKEVEFAEPFRGTTNPAAKYAAGSLPYGPPWIVRVPTSLVILADRRGDLANVTS